MSEDPQATSGTSNQADSTQSSDWQDVGDQFKVLGESLAQAFQAAWQNEENQRRLKEMQAGLESMIRDVGKAIDDTAHSPQGQHFREEAQKTMESLRSASEQTVQEVRPQLIDALQQLNNELQKLVDRMQKKTPPASEKTDEPVS